MELENDIIKFIKKETGVRKIDLNTNIASEECEIFDLDAESLMLSFF